MAETRRPTEGEKLAAGPVMVVLGGQPFPLRVDNRALVILEAKWGSLQAFGEELMKGGRGKVFTAISDLMAACVRDLPPGVDVIDLLEPERFGSGEYADAAIRALQLSGLFGEPDQESAEGAEGNGRGPTSTGPSPGASSSTSPSSSGGSTPSASGT